MSRDHPLRFIPDDRGVDISVYNDELQALINLELNTWFTAPWLFAECYLYRLVRSWFALTVHWSQHDPFEHQKIFTFQASGKAVFQLAVIMADLDDASSSISMDDARLEILFEEMIQMCLWGNATDLSLLPSLDYKDIQALQSVGKIAQVGSMDRILRNDSQQVWELLKDLGDARIDVVLDNSGFELFTDLVLADFLVTHTPFVSKVVFHPKLLPWFVSDVLPKDFASQLAEKDWVSFFASSYPSPSDQEAAALTGMMRRWRSHIASGAFELSVPLDTPIGPLNVDFHRREGADSALDGATFWTLPYSFWRLHEQTSLINQLEKSALVIFKGDLNYRKLTADVKWSASTPLASAIGPLGGHIPILSLRTCKADVVVGLGPGVAEKLDEQEKGWRVSGKYGLISYACKN